MEMLFGFLGALLCIAVFVAGAIFGMKVREPAKPAAGESVMKQVEALQAEEAKQIEKRQKQAAEIDEAWQRVMGYDINQAYAVPGDKGDAT